MSGRALAVFAWLASCYIRETDAARVKPFAHLMPKTLSESRRKLRIVVVSAVLHDGDERNAMLRSGLLASGYDIVASLAADGHLPERIAQFQPDLIIINAASDTRGVLEHIIVANHQERRPIVMFTDDDKTSSMEAAMEAGVSAYVVGFQSKCITPVLNVALARFRHEQKLLGELSEARDKLADRKLIDRAKGLLMTNQRLTEDQAYQKLRGMAMNKNLKLSEIAQRVLDVEDLLG